MFTTPRASTGEDLAVFEEVVSLSRDLRMRNVAGEEVLQPLDPGGEVLDVFVWSVGLETIEDSGTGGVEADSLLLREREIVPATSASGSKSSSTKALLEISMSALMSEVEPATGWILYLASRGVASIGRTPGLVVVPEVSRKK